MHAHILVFVLATAAIFSTALADIHPRNLINFYGIVKAATGRSALDYNSYGNWCGMGGSGEPVDDVDRCCMNHDKCYYRINRNECTGWLHTGAYLVAYKWDVDKDGQVVCLEQKSECAEAACDCDRTAALCFAKSEYHEEHKH